MKVSQVEYKVALRGLGSILTEVLDELVASDIERRPFVVAQDTVTGKFVQFARRYRPKTGELLFDVPALGVVLVPCPDAQTGARWARCALGQHFELPDDATIVVRMDGDPRN
jgi:hypothetical protein